MKIFMGTVSQAFTNGLKSSGLGVGMSEALDASLGKIKKPESTALRVLTHEIGVRIISLIGHIIAQAITTVEAVLKSFAFLVSVPVLTAGLTGVFGESAKGKFIKILASFTGHVGQNVGAALFGNPLKIATHFMPVQLYKN